jgi:hypothetical protein
MQRIADLTPPVNGEATRLAAPKPQPTPKPQPAPPQEQQQHRWMPYTKGGEPAWRSTDGRFTITWAGRHPSRPCPCEELADAKARKRYRGFLSRANAAAMAEQITAGNVYRVGLVACCGEKLGHAAAARELYQSQLFKKASAYAAATCNEWFILSAKHGLVHPDDVTEPCDQTLWTMTAEERRSWGDRVRQQLADRARAGLARLPGGGNALAYSALFVALAGADYCEPLEQHVPIDRPLKGKGIGEQLAFYTAQAQVATTTEGRQAGVSKGAIRATPPRLLAAPSTHPQGGRRPASPFLAQASPAGRLDAPVLFRSSGSVQPTGVPPPGVVQPPGVRGQPSGAAGGPPGRSGAPPLPTWAGDALVTCSR